MTQLEYSSVPAPCLLPGFPRPDSPPISKFISRSATAQITSLQPLIFPDKVHTASHHSGSLSTSIHVCPLPSANNLQPSRRCATFWIVPHSQKGSGALPIWYSYALWYPLSVARYVGPTAWLLHSFLAWGNWPWMLVVYLPVLLCWTLVSACLSNSSSWPCCLPSRCPLTHDSLRSVARSLTSSSIHEL